MSKLYPIAEIFQAPQGEGRWTGTYMTFVRLAGCTVGKPYTAAEREQHQKDAADLDMPIIQPYQEQCTAWNGTKFACDTNYRKSDTLHVDDIVMMCPTERVLITGGEPLMHDLDPLLFRLAAHHKKVHFETSGTIKLGNIINSCEAFGLPSWICVSPKAGCLDESLERCDEIKILVDKKVTDEVLLARFAKYISQNKVWLQPINDEHTLNRENVDYCVDLQRKLPKVILSLQAHKVWGTR